MNHQTVSVTHYRKRAKRMRKLAADEPAQDVRDELLELADDYDRIALLAAEGVEETNHAVSKAQRQ
jgi:molecular chaperone GrpE (heat shock protein)